MKLLGIKRFVINLGSKFKKSFPILIILTEYYYFYIKPSSLFTVYISYIIKPENVVHVCMVFTDSLKRYSFVEALNFKFYILWTIIKFLMIV